MDEAEAIVQSIEGFLAESPRALVVEEGVVAFDLATARFSVAADRGRCLLHLWSEERSAVRRVLKVQRKSDVLKLSVQRFGQARPTTLEICRSSDRRSPTQRKRARQMYEQLLRRVLPGNFPGFTLDKLSSRVDLGRSFGPVYTRALLRRGGSALAVLGVNRQETQSSIDAALTFGILWLDYCRTLERRAHVEGLVLLLPTGSTSVTRERITHLDTNAARWQLHELEEDSGTLQPVECSDRGNVATRLVHCPDEAATRRRFAESIRRVHELTPEAETVVLSGSEIGFRVHGLEFARARMVPDSATFRHKEQIVFGVGASEAVLDENAEERFSLLVRGLAARRRADGERNDPLWRVAAERWLESLVVQDVRAIDARLDGSWTYSQVPAFSASDRAMIDVLSVTREGRLALVELKADEDIHLPLQGIDYWSRVVWHQERGEFQRFGYFAGKPLSDQKPLLLLVAPALQIHPATDTLLRYISPEVEYEVVGIDERWREKLRVVFRKRKPRESAHSVRTLERQKDEEPTEG